MARFAPYRSVPTLPRRKLTREEMAALIRKNAEDLLMEICGERYDGLQSPLPHKRGKVRFK